MHNMKIPHNNISLSLFLINACPLNKNFDDLQDLLGCNKSNWHYVTQESQTSIVIK